MSAYRNRHDAFMQQQAVGRVLYENDGEDILALH